MDATVRLEPTPLPLILQLRLIVYPVGHTAMERRALQSILVDL
jgi:hypothetical protein